MPRHSLLAAGYHVRLFDIPAAPVELARHDVLGCEDLLMIRAKRHAFIAQALPSNFTCYAPRARTFVAVSTRLFQLTVRPHTDGMQTISHTR